jgi:TupA-like ATPgrasp
MASNPFSSVHVTDASQSLSPSFVRTGLRDRVQLLAKLARIRLLYLWRHGRLPNMAQPRLFTEFVQLRKLESPNQSISALIDKVKVKEFAADTIGEEWIILTLWHGLILPNKPIWPYPFIVKSSHGCNQYIVVKSAAHDWEAVKKASAQWVQRPYGAWLDEGYYAAVKPGILVEPFVGDGDALPIDYKLYVFGGTTQYVQVHLDRATNHRWAIFDRNWNCLTKQTCDGAQPPATLNAMIAAAETMADGLDFVRVDFYEIAGKPLFGEMTFYPGSGLDPFDPPMIDGLMGTLWRDAIAAKKGIK